VAAKGGNISPRAASALARLVGSDLRTMAGEIDKLVLFARGRQIEEADVRTMVGYSQQTTIFAMIDAILDSRTELAEQSLQQLLRDGAAPSYVLTMLARQAQLIVRAKELKAQRLPNNEMQSKLGLANEFAFRKTLDQAGRHSLDRMREFYHKLLETDLAIKTGQMDAELAVTVLVADLARDVQYT
jgi:DNA polymerase-3 subunit delta